MQELIEFGLPVAKRDPNKSKSGKAPTFQIRITPELKAQFEEAAKEEGMSVGNWLKSLGRKELEKENNKAIDLFYCLVGILINFMQNINRCSFYKIILLNSMYM